MIASGRVVEALDGDEFLFSESVLEIGDPAWVRGQSLDETVKEVSYFCGVRP